MKKNKLMGKGELSLMTKVTYMKERSVIIKSMAIVS